MNLSHQRTRTDAASNVMGLSHRRRKIAVAGSTLLFATIAALWLFAIRWEPFCSHASMHAPTADVPWYSWRGWTMKAMGAGFYVRSDFWEVGNPHFADQREPKVGTWLWGVQSASEDGLRLGFPYNLRPFMSNVYSGPSSSRAQVHSRHTFAAYLPWWPVLVFTSLLPTIAVIRHIRYVRRKTLNRCPQCTYDLTGNTTGVCPECGGVIKRLG
jgi:hypothetical protein